MTAEEILDGCEHVVPGGMPGGPCYACALSAVEVAREEEREACAKRLDELIEHGKKALSEVESEKVWPAGHAYKFKFLRGWVEALVHAADAIRSRRSP